MDFSRRRRRAAAAIAFTKRTEFWRCVGMEKFNVRGSEKKFSIFAVVKDKIIAVFKLRHTHTCVREGGGVTECVCLHVRQKHSSALPRFIPFLNDFV